MLGIEEARELLRNPQSLEDIEKAYGRVLCDINNDELVTIQLNKKELIFLITNIELSSYDIGKEYLDNFVKKVEYETENGRLYTICGMSDRLTLNKKRLETDFSIEELVDFYYVLTEYKENF